MSGHCGGCRARAYGMTGDLMAEDPLCTHTPGTFAGSPLLTLGGAPKARPAGAERGNGVPASDGDGGSGGAKPPGQTIEYGAESPKTIEWEDAAAARMKKIPAFVRGMVVRAVEDSCRKNGIDRVTVDELERIRARMPTPKLFGVPQAHVAGAERGDGVPAPRPGSGRSEPEPKGLSDGGGAGGAKPSG